MSKYTYIFITIALLVSGGANATDLKCFDDENGDGIDIPWSARSGHLT